MQGIEFETDEVGRENRAQESSEHRISTMARWLMLIGITDSSTANYVLMSIAGVGIILTIFLYSKILS